MGLVVDHVSLLGQSGKWSVWGLPELVFLPLTQWPAPFKGQLLFSNDKHLYQLPMDK